MPLSLNPVAVLGSAATSTLASVANQAAGNLGLPNTNVAKNSLDNLINDQSGGIGSALNGVTGQLRSTSFSNLSSTVQSSLQSGGLNSLSSAISSGIGGIAGKIENIASGIAPGLASGLITGALQAAAAQGNAFAGVAADLVSAARSRNLPTTETLQLFNPASVVAVYPSNSGDWRVKVQSFAGEIVFPVTPSVSLTNAASYDMKSLVHANFPHPVYTNSQSGEVSISCEWPVETSAEAAEWLRVIRLGRALTKMFFGSSSPLGNPPPICTLVGYEDTLKNIPVIVKEFKVEMKDDCHYISAGGAYVPRLSSISMSLSTVYSKTAQRGFSWSAYARGAGNIPF